jgi:hypothetical protein
MAFKKPLQVDFTSTPTSGEEPLTVLFEADYQGEERATYEWDFGDGNISTDPRSSIVSHTYKAGTYTVSLTVTDGTASGTETKENLITVDPAYSPVLEARTKSFHSHRYGKRVCVRLRVKNVGDEMIRKIKVTMYSANGPDADRATWTLLKERERTFHRRWPLKHNRGKNVWMRYNSGTDESLSGKYLILEVYPVEGDFENAATFEKAATNDKVSVKILVP